MRQNRQRALKGSQIKERILAVRKSFARQNFMGHLGARIVSVGPGTTELRLRRKDTLLQQHGYFHGGAIATLADVAGGYAAFSLMGPDDSVLTVEFKLNIMAPGDGGELRALGQVIRAGRTLTIVRADVFVRKNGRESLCATSLQTLMRMAGKKEQDRL